MPPRSARYYFRMADAPTCPRCDYSLVGLGIPSTIPSNGPSTNSDALRTPMDQQATCPECGLSFTWREVLEPPAWPSWSFEHARSVRRRTMLAALLGTIARSLVPGILWSRLTLGLPFRPRRLVALAAASLVAGTVLSLVVYNAMAVGYVAVEVHLLQAGGFFGIWQSSIYNGWNMLTNPFALPRSRQGMSRLGPAMAVALLWALAPTAFLLAPTTLRRARVQPRHFARLLASWCVWLPILVCVPQLMALLLSLLDSLRRHGLVGMSDTLRDHFATICSGVLLAAAWWWWARASERYLRLARPWMTTAVLLVVASLATAVLTWAIPGSRVFITILFLEFI